MQRIPSITLILLIILNFLLLIGVAWCKTAIDDSTSKVENLPAIARTVDKKVDTTVDAEKKMSQYNKLRANWYFLKYFQFKGLCSRISIFSLTLQSRKWLYIHTNVRSSAHLTVCFQNSPSSFKFILHFSTFKLFSLFFLIHIGFQASEPRKLQIQNIQHYENQILTLGSLPNNSNTEGIFLTEWQMMKIKTISRDILASLCSLLRSLLSILLLSGFEIKCD